MNYHYTKQNKTKNQLIETRNAENDFPVRSCLSVNILYSKYTYDNAHLLSHLQIEFSLSEGITVKVFNNDTRRYDRQVAYFALL